MSSQESLVNWTLVMCEENRGAPVWSQLNEHAGGGRSQGIFKGSAYERHWIKTAIVAGLCACILYLTRTFAPSPPRAKAAVAAFLGPAICISSIGLHFLLHLNGRSVAAVLGSIHNVLPGCLFSAMALVQRAAKQYAPESMRKPVSIWLGLDVAWDIYNGLGTLFFAYAVTRHPRFRWPFAASGFVLGALVIVLNLIPFPVLPAGAGYLDVGPFVGVWYLAVVIQAWRSLQWAGQRLGAVA